MQDEMVAMRGNGTWDIVPRHPRMNVIGSKWVFRIKQKANGPLEQY